MTKKYIIAIDIQTTSPMHIGAIEKGRYNFDTGRIERYDSGIGGVGCALTRTHPLIDGSQVPVIPASTIGGKLRRAAADKLINSFVQRQLLVTPDAYNMLYTGSSTTTINAKEATPESKVVARTDPFMALFGGSTMMESSHVVTAPGWPLLECTAQILMSEPIAPVLPLTKLTEMTDAYAIVKKNAVGDMEGNNIVQAVGAVALAEYLAGESKSRSASKSKKNDESDGKKTDIRTLNAREATRTGLGFALRFEVTARLESHLGFFLLALQDELRDGQFGGVKAKGLGRYNVVASRLYEVDPQSRHVTVLSKLFQDKATGYAFAESDLIDDVVTNAQDYIDTAEPWVYDAFAKGDMSRFNTAKVAA